MRLHACLLVLASATAAFAAPPVKQLDRAQLADGWLQLWDGSSDYGWKVEGEAKIADGKWILGGEKATRIVSSAPLPQSDYRFVFEPAGAKVVLKWGDAVLSAGEGFSPTTGMARYALEVPAGSRVAIRSIHVKPKGSKSLFNGKDLAGWKQFPDKKSKFTVTPEGWLNVQDGPGDLQTEGQWADFVVQLECISNGKHLNSGLFLRCLPGVYQQGYEAQIRNEWTGDDRSKPVDFGTGAIYRRQPARYVNSTDGEWFAMAVLARGPQLCTWVDGIQVADFTDERPENPNGRNGRKVGPGCLSIQGHDPTTNLSFRNLRIVEVK